MPSAAAGTARDHHKPCQYPARDEYRAWLAARSTGTAITELLGAARGEDALIRGLAFEALRVVGAPAGDLQRAVCGLDPKAILTHPQLIAGTQPVRGPRIEQVRISRLDAAAQPPTISVEVDVRGRRYLEDRDTAAVLSGSRENETSFTERWTLALDGDKVMLESLLAFKRAGAAGVLTYFAPMAARMLKT